MVWEMSFEEFQYGCHCGHLGYQNGTILAILNLYVALMPPIKFWLKQTNGLGGDVVWRIPRWPPGHHLGYQKGTIFAILNLYNAPMPPIKFRLNLTYGLGGDVVWRISDRLSWLWKWNDFSNCESMCPCDASHQVLAQSNLRFGRCRLKNFKMATMEAILDIRMERS